MQVFTGALTQETKAVDFAEGSHFGRLSNRRLQASLPDRAIRLRSSTSIYRPETGDRILALALCRRRLAAPHAQNTAPSHSRIKIVGRTMDRPRQHERYEGDKARITCSLNANENIRFMLSKVVKSAAYIKR